MRLCGAGASVLLLALALFLQQLVALALCLQQLHHLIALRGLGLRV